MERKLPSTGDIDKTNQESPDERSSIPVRNRRSHIRNTAENNHPRNYDRNRDPGHKGKNGRQQSQYDYDHRPDPMDVW